MKFLIKNYNKDTDNDREILATVLFEVETIKEAQEKMAEFIKEIKNNWQTNLKMAKLSEQQLPWLSIYITSLMAWILKITETEITKNL